MAIPFLYRLPKSARAAYPFIQAGTRRGLSSRAIERLVRRAGLPISRGRTIVPLMREIRIIEAQGSAVRFIPKTAVINVTRLPEALVPIRKNYSYLVRVRGLDPFGEFIERNVRVITDRLTMTPGEVEDIARSKVIEGGISDSLEEVEVTIQEGIRKFGVPF